MTRINSRNETKAARQLEWKMMEFQKMGLRDMQAMDPTSVGAHQTRDLGRGVEIMFGRVMDSIPYAGIYKVLPERGLSVITCCHVGHGPNGAIGVRSVSSLPPGVHVWFIYHRDVNYGVIIGVEPYFMTDPRQALSDYIYLGSRSGLHRDVAFSYPWRTNTRGLGDWSAGTPFDEAADGTWGGITRTGLRMLLDDFMVQVGAGEACGLYAYLWDQLCRLTGINLQIRANCFEWEALDDESEHFDVLGHSVYPWETMGAGRQTSGLYREHTAKETQVEKPWYAAIEPAYDNQMPVRRVLSFGGYLGQGGKRLVQAPTDATIWRYGNPGGLASVFEEQVTLPGAYALRSAKSVIIARRPLIPKIYQKRRPDDAAGDNKDNYRASGTFGSGPRHEVTGDIDTPGDFEDNQKRIAGVQDLIAYVFNWEGAHAFHYHENDWTVSQETESDLGSSIPLPQFRPLVGNSKMFMPDPPKASLPIDHRYGTVEYALCNSYIVLTEDGGIAIGDGYGAEIRMSGGHIANTAPGDVWHRAGRHVGCWGGRDVLVRAHNCVDISATEKDIRLGANRHLWAVAGLEEGNQGLLLLESRAVSRDYIFKADDSGGMIGEDAEASGIALRVENANIVNWGRDIYLRTGGGSVSQGDIYLDAGRGTRSLLTNSTFIGHYLKPASGAGRYDAFYVGDTTIEVKAVNAFTGVYNLLGAWSAVYGDLAVDGRYFGNGWIYTIGHIGTTEAATYNFLVPPILPDELVKFFKQLAEVVEALKKALAAYFMATFTTLFYQDLKAGDAEVMTIAEYSWRTSQQCGTASEDGSETSFRLFEDRWQQMDRMAGGASVKWSEVWATTQGIQTGPYPGKEAMTNSESYIEMPLTIYDPETGASRSRGSADSVAECYAQPKYGEPSPKALDGNYRILG